MVAVLPIQRAFQLHQQGQLDAAKKIYWSILQQQPSNFDARQLLGVLLSTQGHNAEALPHLQKALKLKSSDDRRARSKLKFSTFRLD